MNVFFMIETICIYSLIMKTSKYIYTTHTYNKDTKKQIREYKSILDLTGIYKNVLINDSVGVLYIIFLIVLAYILYLIKMVYMF